MNDMPSTADRHQSLSVVVPCYNEEAILRQVHGQLGEVLQRTGLPYEIIYVNDGSSDGTLAILRELQAGDEHVRVVSFSRNFGHQVAVTAGIDCATGDAVVLIDADLQDPPEVILRMIEKWREGYEVVYGKRESRDGETALRLFITGKFYRLINSISDVPIPLDTGDFRLMDRRIVDVLKKMPERDRFLRGMVSWVGFKQLALPYARHCRAAGRSKYPYSKLILLAADGILSFSLVPLRVAILLGFLAAGFAVVGIVYAVILRLFTGIWVMGWTLMFIGILFLGGMTLGCLGIIGEYVGRIYREVKRRPLYVVDEMLGFEPDAAARPPQR
jgi:polyisoprenyl-phosphate glycosyltransferase